MSEHGDKMIADAVSKLRDTEQKVVDLKKFINQVCEFENRPPMFDESQIGGPSPSKCEAGIRSDQFYGQPLATVVRGILTMRKTAGLGAATVAEIYARMNEGGFEFATEDPENAKRALRISLTKNPAFHKIPSGAYGLREWYPNIRETKPKREGQENGGAESPEPNIDELLDGVVDDKSESEELF